MSVPMVVSFLVAERLGLVLICCRYPENTSRKNVKGFCTTQPALFGFDSTSHPHAQRNKQFSSHNVVTSSVHWFFATF